MNPPPPTAELRSPPRRVKYPVCLPGLGSPDPSAAGHFSNRRSLRIAGLLTLHLPNRGLDSI